MQISFRHYNGSFLVTFIVTTALVTAICLQSLEAVLQWLPSVSTVAVVGAVLSLYDRWLWKPLPYLLTVRDISGRYIGELVSSYKDVAENARAEIIVEVHQTASTVVVRQFTRDRTQSWTQSQSRSYHLYRRADGSHTLSFAYQNEGVHPRTTKHEHWGFCIMDFYADHQCAHGHYFTDRQPQTSGKIELEFQQRRLKGGP